MGLSSLNILVNFTVHSTDCMNDCSRENKKERIVLPIWLPGPSNDKKTDLIYYGKSTLGTRYKFFNFREACARQV